MKKSKLLLTSAILGLAYLVYLIFYFSTSMINASNGLELIAGGMATAVITPHMVCVGLALLFNFIGWLSNTRWAALVAGILYAVSILFMFLYAIFVIVQTILCFIAFAKMEKKLN